MVRDLDTLYAEEPRKSENRSRMPRDNEGDIAVSHERLIHHDISLREPMHCCAGSLRKDRLGAGGLIEGAFFAASMRSMRSFAAQMAFMLLGPMFDLKLLFMYRAVFRGRFIAALAGTVAISVLVTVLGIHFLSKGGSGGREWTALRVSRKWRTIPQ